MTHPSLLSDFCVFEDAAVLTLCFFCAPDVELVLEIHKYDFWRNVLIHDM